MNDKDEKNSVSFLNVCKSVLMSFLGVQKESVRERDFKIGKPAHFIIVGILLTLVLIGILITAVQLLLHTVN
jgi:hypothetical protein